MYSWCFRKMCVIVKRVFVFELYIEWRQAPALLHVMIGSHSEGDSYHCRHTFDLKTFQVFKVYMTLRKHTDPVRNDEFKPSFKSKLYQHVASNRNTPYLIKIYHLTEQKQTNVTQSHPHKSPRNLGVLPSPILCLLSFFSIALTNSIANVILLKSRSKKSFRKIVYNKHQFIFNKPNQREYKPIRLLRTRHWNIISMFIYHYHNLKIINIDRT